MPVHLHKKDTTPTSPSSKQEPTTPELPDQQTFREYLRELARDAIRVVMEDVMREELDAVIGVGWGECSPKRKGYRNGSRLIPLATHFVSDSGLFDEVHHRLEQIVVDPHLLVERIHRLDLLGAIKAQGAYVLARLRCHSSVQRCDYRFSDTGDCARGAPPRLSPSNSAPGDH